MIPNVVHDPTGLQLPFEDFDLTLAAGGGWEMGWVSDEKDPVLGRS